MSLVQQRHPKGPAISRRTLARFLTAYGAQCGALAPQPLTETRLQKFLRDMQVPIAHAHRRRLAEERKEATRFNVFDLMEPDENKLSDVLADLVDPRGQHGQGELFLRLLLAELKMDWSTKFLASANVEREAATYALSKRRRRIDILVEAGFMLAIENKKDSPEQPHQVRDYLAHLARCAASNRQPYALIYLTPDSHSPPSLTAGALQAKRAARQFVCWGYPRELRRWLELCLRECQAAKVQHFLADFINFTTTVLHRDERNEGPERDHER